MIKKKRLMKKTVKKAIDSCDWGMLEKHIESIEASHDDIAVLCEMILRNQSLICRYTQKDDECTKGSFIDKVYIYIAGRYGVDAAKGIDDCRVLITLIETGYRIINSMLEERRMGLPGSEQIISGTISYAFRVYNAIMGAVASSQGDEGILDLRRDICLQDRDGTKYNPDSVIEFMSSCVANTIAREASINGWSRGDIIVLPVLPVLPVTTDETLRAAERIQSVIVALTQWRRMEERRRYIGGSLEILIRDVKAQSEKTKPNILLSYTKLPNVEPCCEEYDYIANTRLKERLTQSYMQLAVATNVRCKITGIFKGAKLPPDDIVSVDELHAILFIEDILGYSILEDRERPGGIRIIEWIRGYAVLQCMVQESIDSETEAGRAIGPYIERNDLLDNLEKNGLAKDAARRLIDLLSLHKSSSDLFDCPLIAIESSKYLAFFPSVVGSHIALSILSNLSRREIDLSRKGAAFEASVRSLFQEQKLKVFSFKFTREREVYEYDAVVLWGDHLFVFECKNRNLSWNRPVQTNNFHVQVLSAAKQARRLAFALKTYPEIVEKKMKIEPHGLSIIPCVLHSFPYSQFGPVDGVYFCDMSSIWRFFQSPYYNILGISNNMGDRDISKIPIKRVWRNDTPDVHDFVQHLSRPYQLDLIMSRMTKRRIIHRISESALLETDEYFQE